MSVLLASPRCRWNNKTILHALVQCPELSGLIVYAKHVLSHLRRVPLLTESMIKIVPSLGLSKEGKASFLFTITILKECMWKSRMKES